MPISIKNSETERLARNLAQLTGEPSPKPITSLAKQRNRLSVVRLLLDENLSPGQAAPPH